MSDESETIGSGTGAKRVVAIALLAFVGVSVVYALAGRGGTDRKGAATVAGTEAAPAGRTVIAYYFYGDVRCDTCRKIEAYARSAIGAGFANELAGDALQWRPMNVDKPENEHFVHDYSLFTRSLVLSEMVNGREARWKNLDRIWELVGDRSAFDAYVQGEVAGFLQEQ